MSSPRAQSTLPTSRIFGTNDSVVDDDIETLHPTEFGLRRVLGRFSFSGPSFSRRMAGHDGEDTPDVTNASERPPVPTVMQPSNEVFSTPLPVLSMIVLSITMLGEFLSANVSTPFLLFMVKGFGEYRDEAEVAFWTGILVSAFFMTQFLTSLLWATVAEQHGRRTVLIISLLGSAGTCCIFGTSTSLQQAISIRLLQGIFAGAVGVARGSVAFVTDSSNEGRAYAILGFCWGFGGVAGAIIGGSFEQPASKWPGIFGNVELFVKYPYLLPCAIAASITFIGSILACFLGQDGGPRHGAIRLLPEKFDIHPNIPEEESTLPSPIFEEPERRSLVSSIGRNVSRKLSAIFAKRVYDAHGQTPINTNSPQPVPLSSPVSHGNRSRTYSQTSKANGSAYGYSGSYQRRLASNAMLGSRRGSIASSLRRRGSNAVGSRAMSNADGSEFNFAQRLLMANENAVTNIADLWVAAAMNVDNENPFESDSEDDTDDSRRADVSPRADADANRSASATPTRRGRLLHEGLQSPTPLQSHLSRSPIPHRDSTPSVTFQTGSPRRVPRAMRVGSHHTSFSRSMDISPMSRRHSSNIPSIFSHTGVRTPPALIDAQQLLTRTEHETPPGDDILAPILESNRVSTSDALDDIEFLSEKQPSLTSQLPLMVIAQYGLLALHSTTHDQVFMSYLVSDYKAGGLNLNAGHFAQLIALMCLAQIAYQFYLYPPPRGRFSHLAMFRIGSALFIPAYLTVILYRPFASAENDGNFVLMTALALSTALRFCGITFGYTAISILLNYMTPPAAVGFANGIAQSIVSLARCFGPVLGGYLWSVSVQDDPSGYPLGFVACAGVCALGVVSSYLIR